MMSLLTLLALPGLSRGLMTLAVGVWGGDWLYRHVTLSNKTNAEKIALLLALAAVAYALTRPN